jgi:hypothetical protein
MVRSPKSARQRMTALIDQDIGLAKRASQAADSDERSKSYPLQVSVYHRLTVHIYQPLSDVFELRENDHEGWPSTLEIKPHKLETIRILMDFDELVDVPILHPLRCHCEEGKGIIHHYPQQWQHVRMAKKLPSYNLLAEPLEWEESAALCALVTGPWEPTLVIFSKSLVE